MEIYEENDIFPKTLRQIFELTKCTQRQARISCLKHDMRKLLSDEASENGTLTDIFEDLLERVVEIATLSDQFDRVDSLVLDSYT